MRIAISGTHASGKSTLIGELVHLLPNYLPVQESYYALLEQGHVFAEAPSLEDFELQLDRSLDLISNTRGSDVIFERCPVDYLAYIASLRNTDRRVLAGLLGPVTAAMSSVDLTVYIPVEYPDRISVTDAERPRLRKRVDAVLREVLVDDAWGIGARVLEVTGTVSARVDQVIVRIETSSAT